MPTAVIAQIDEMRSGKQQAATRHQHAVGDHRRVPEKRDTKHQQRYARCCKEQRQRFLMTTEATPQRQRRQDTGEQHKSTLKPVIREKTQADKR